MFRWLFSLRWTAFDVALAAGLVVATAGQLGGGDTPGWVWWLFTPLLVAGVLLRRWWPLLAVCVATAGFVGQHVELGPTPLPIDLAVPLAFYTLASVERPRRAVVLVSLALIGVITALGAMHVLLNTRSEVVEVGEEMLPEEEQAKFPKQFAHVGWPADAEVPPPKIDPPPDPGDLLSAALRPFDLVGIPRGRHPPRARRREHQRRVGGDLPLDGLRQLRRRIASRPAGTICPGHTLASKRAPSAASRATTVWMVTRTGRRMRAVCPKRVRNS